MRILMISDVYFPRVNGVSTSIMTFRHALEQQGHSVTLVAPRYPNASDPDERLVRIKSRYLVMDPEDRMMRYKDIVKLTDSLSAENFDLIHIQTPFVAHYAGLELARRLGLPTVETYHTFFEEYLYHYIKFLPRSLMRLLARRFSCAQCNSVNGLIVPSTPMLNVLRDYGVTVDAEVIATGLSSNQFNPGDGKRFRHVHHIAPGRPIMLFVGRVVFEKNIEFLVKITREVKLSIPNILFIIAGEGPAEKHLQKAAIQNGLEKNIMFVGYLDREQGLPDCYAASDVFIFASRTETQGLVLLEAMALGTPLVSTAVMGTKDILRNNQGAIVAKESLEDFSDKVVRVLENDQLRAKLGRNAVSEAHKWEQSVFVAKTLDFYQKVVSASVTNHAPAVYAGTK
jgi:glycosyltransferase involved in cell wall biosynthesis